MADQATLRIKIEDNGGQPSASRPAQPLQPPMAGRPAARPSRDSQEKKEDSGRPGRRPDLKAEPIQVFLDAMKDAEPSIKNFKKAIDAAEKSQRKETRESEGAAKRLRRLQRETATQRFSRRFAIGAGTATEQQRIDERLSRLVRERQGQQQGGGDSNIIPFLLGRSSKAIQARGVAAAGRVAPAAGRAAAGLTKFAASLGPPGIALAVFTAALIAGAAAVASVIALSIKSVNKFASEVKSVVPTIATAAVSAERILNRARRQAGQRAAPEVAQFLREQAGAQAELIKMRGEVSKLASVFIATPFMKIAQDLLRPIINFLEEINDNITENKQKTIQMLDLAIKFSNFMQMTDAKFIVITKILKSIKETLEEINQPENINAELAQAFGIDPRIVGVGLNDNEGNGG